MPNESATWNYDAAGNVNRATSIGGVTCTSHILGNRLTKGTATYGSDVLNRMTSYTAGGVTTSYVYRADGMRVSKSDSTDSAVYRYDGQMAMQDVETVGSTVTTTNYALGARGVDAVSKTDSSGTSVGYPIYDAHGNRVATLTKSGTSFSLTDLRTYDAWGSVRAGAQTGRPRARYCANLGHVQDDESGLVYMRARYYEPTSGRFVSEDTKMHGRNWFVYCSNKPTFLSDTSGKDEVHDIMTLMGDYKEFVEDLAGLVACAAICYTAKMVALSGLLLLLYWCGDASTVGSWNAIGVASVGALIAADIGLIADCTLLGLVGQGMNQGMALAAGVSTLGAYMLTLKLFFDLCDLEADEGK